MNDPLRGEHSPPEVIDLPVAAVYARIAEAFTINETSLHAPSPRVATRGLRRGLLPPTTQYRILSF